MKYGHFDVLSFECRGLDPPWTLSDFTGLVPQDKLSYRQNLKNYRNVEKKTA